MNLGLPRELDHGTGDGNGFSGALEDVEAEVQERSGRVGKVLQV